VLLGNMGLCSKNMIIGNVPSRRDDLISLVYMLLYIYLGSMKFLQLDTDNDSYEKIAHMKSISTPE
jgi:hypothetical protein